MLWGLGGGGTSTVQAGVPEKLDGLIMTISKTIKNISRGAKVHIIANGKYQNLLIQCCEFTTAASCKCTLSHKFSICFGY